MSGIKYIGRTTDFRGKTLWEIVGNLRDLGVGRLVVRNMFQRYKEPCYMRILKVQAADAQVLDNPDVYRKVHVTVEKTWRGVTLPKPIEIFSASYKPDYYLVPKSKEIEYLKNDDKVDQTVISKELSFPPLLREFISEETGQSDPKMSIHFKKYAQKFVRTAENEKPQKNLTMGLGEPASPGLYKGIL